jgi:hypothetical protein
VLNHNIMRPDQAAECISFRVPDESHLSMNRCGETMQQGASNRLTAPARTPLAASAEPERLVKVPGLLDAQGEPVLAVATGSSRRPLLRAFASSTAALVALRTAGGLA